MRRVPPPQPLYRIEKEYAWCLSDLFSSPPLRVSISPMKTVPCSSVCVRAQRRHYLHINEQHARKLSLDEITQQTVLVLQ